MNGGLSCIDTVVEHGNKLKKIDIVSIFCIDFYMASQIVCKMDRFISLVYK